MIYHFALAPVLNRGSAPAPFLDQLVTWAKTAQDEIFAHNDLADIYGKVIDELGPFDTIVQRKAVMLEVMRVLALFESGCDWTEGVDTSRLGADTPANAEAGAWQVSWDSRTEAAELPRLLAANGVMDAIQFQQAMKFNHPLAMEYIARLLRHTTKANGPLYKGDERLVIRKSLRGPENSIYPWLSRNAVLEFAGLLA